MADRTFLFLIFMFLLAGLVISGFTVQQYRQYKAETDCIRDGNPGYICYSAIHGGMR